MRRLLILLPAGLLAAACGGYGGGSSSSGTNGNAVVQTIQVSEKEYSLNPGTITVPKPGNYALEVTNDGKITHAFTVEASGGGGEVESGDIRPGSKKTIKFTFQGGKRYEVYCPIDGHKAMGMAGTISVGEAAGGGAAGGGTTTNPEGETTTSGVPGY